MDNFNSEDRKEDNTQQINIKEMTIGILQLPEKMLELERHILALTKKINSCQVRKNKFMTEFSQK